MSDDGPITERGDPRDRIANQRTVPPVTARHDKAACLFPLDDGRRCLECETCQGHDPLDKATEGRTCGEKFSGTVMAPIPYPACGWEPVQENDKCVRPAGHEGWHQGERIEWEATA